MSEATSTENTSTKKFAQHGHDPETGLLHRMRHWDDVLPPIRLARIMRGLASPVLLGIILVTFLIDDQVCHLIDAATASVATPNPASENMMGSAIVPVRSVWESLIPPIQVVFDSDPAVGSDSSDTANAWQSIGKFFFRWLLWITPLMVLMRQGACLTAGRTMDPAKQTFRLALSRMPQAAFMMLVPAMCSLVFALGIVAMAWISGKLPDVNGLSSAIALFVVVAAIPAGLLLAASITSVPLGLAAMVNERNSDPLDALSRGYESTFRGGLALVGNGLVGCVILLPVFCGAAVFAWVTEAFLDRLVTMVGRNEMMVDLRFWLRWIVPTGLMTAMGLLMGGIYLLMRRQVGGQEVEDLWEFAPPLRPDLPELPRSGEASSS